MITISNSSVSTADTIFIIDCLSPGELQTGKNRTEEIFNEVLRSEPNLSDDEIKKISHVYCSKLDDFLDLIQKIKDICRNGALPLLFIDGHGHSELGLQFPSGEYIGWDDYLNCLKMVTETTKGELTVVAAFCHSMKILGRIGVSDKLPFSFYYGYEDEVKAGTIEIETHEIIKKIIRDGGKGLRKNPGSMTGYSEYDHVEKLILPAIALMKNPAELAMAMPELSKGQLRSRLDQKLASEGTPLSGSRKIFEKIINSSLLATELIKTVMHDTYRRKRLIDEVTSQIDGDVNSTNTPIEYNEGD